MHTTTALWWAALTTAMMAPAALAMAVANGQAAPIDDAAAIRNARADSNAAIARHDVAGIAKHWLPDVSIVTSTGAHGNTSTANAARMEAQFSRRPDTIYVRTPTAVDVFPAWRVGSERGEWTGRWTEPDGVVNISGTYLAHWRHVDGAWRIQAEVFVPTRCTGSRYCSSRP